MDYARIPSSKQWTSSFNEAYDPTYKISLESESEYFSTRHRSGVQYLLPRWLIFFLNLNF